MLENSLSPSCGDEALYIMHAARQVLLRTDEVAATANIGPAAVLASGVRCYNMCAPERERESISYMYVYIGTVLQTRSGELTSLDARGACASYMANKKIIVGRIDH